MLVIKIHLYNIYYKFKKIMDKEILNKHIKYFNLL